MTGSLVPSLAVVLMAATGTGQELPLPWLASIGLSGERPAIHTIATEADVQVSDGDTYKAATVFHDRQRAVFRSVSDEGTTTLGVDGRYIWSYDGAVEREAGEAVEDFVLGHQLHAQLLFFDTLQDSLGEPVGGQFDGTECLTLTSFGASPWTIFYRAGGLPLGLEKRRDGEPNILFRLGAWRDVEGLQLPHEVTIDDGERQFHYRYSFVRINQGAMADFRAPYGMLTDEQKLLRLHRLVMDDHFFGRVAAMQAVCADTLFLANAGEIWVTTGEEWNDEFERMMSTLDYSVYDDRIRPVVRISRDGTLGWVLVQASAVGVRLGADGRETGPLEFTCAWIELYEKTGDDWRMTGNVSNFVPEGR